MNRIKELRKACGLTQVELAERAGVDQQHISALEKGRIKVPTLPVALRLAAVLGVQPADLLTDPELTAQPDAPDAPPVALEVLAS